MPKVIDFGIAKAATDQHPTDKTLYTAMEQFIATPAYMSPQQANLSGLDVDNRSDIYSLGVLLYELLTGRTPFGALAAGRYPEALARLAKVCLRSTLRLAGSLKATKPSASKPLAKVLQLKFSKTGYRLFRNKAPSSFPISEVTQILEAAQRGDPKAADELLPLVYGELRKLATARMANEAAGHTLQPTDLVHEAWLRLVKNQNPQFHGRAHFFAAAAEAMRRILIDRARRKQAVRHGGGQQRVDFEEVQLTSSVPDDQLLAVNDALDKLATLHPREAELVKLRYFVGMTVQEAADVLGISADTAKDYSAHARAWLLLEIKKSNG